MFLKIYIIQKKYTYVLHESNSLALILTYITTNYSEIAINLIPVIIYLIYLKLISKKKVFCINV